MQKYDVIVVGGSFAGLSFAESAALKGLNVLVIEKDKEFGDTIRTTGIFFDETLNILNIPNYLIINRIADVNWYFANKKPINISRRHSRFYMTDTRGIIKFMANEAKTAGACLKSKTIFVDAKVMKNNSIIVKTNGDNFECKYVIGADGALSKVAEVFGLDRNTNFFEGIERILSGESLPTETYHCLIDYNIAPGYLTWLTPHGKDIAFGLAAYPDKINVQYSIKKAENFFRKIIPIEELNIIEKKAGLIPVGGILKNFYNQHALLIGDAGGFCGTLSAGGIFPALVTGQIAAMQVAKMLEDNNIKVLSNFINQVNSQYNLLNYLKIEKVIRTLFDELDSNKEIQDFGKLLETKEGRILLDNILMTYIPELRGIELLKQFLKTLLQLKELPKSLKLVKSLLKGNN